MAAQTISLWARRSGENKLEMLKKKVPERILNIFQECIMELFKKTDLTEEELVLLLTPLFREKNLPEKIENYKVTEFRKNIEKKNYVLSEYKNLLLGNYSWRIIQLKTLIRELPPEKRKLLTYYFCLILRTFI